MATLKKYNIRVLYRTCETLLTVTINWHCVLSLWSYSCSIASWIYSCSIAC